MGYEIPLASFSMKLIGEDGGVIDVHHDRLI